MPARNGHKVLFVIRSLNIGGAERQLVELAAGLRAAGWDVIVSTFYGKGALAPLLAEHGVRYVSLQKHGRWDVLRFIWRLIRLVRAERPDVVYSMLPMSNVLVAIARPFFRGARVVWGVATSNMDLSYYDFLAKVEAALEVRLSRNADLIICNSHAGRDCHVARGFPASRMRVIPNGIDTNCFKPDEGARREMRAAWGVAAGEILIGLVGRLDPIKDHRNFLRAAAKVSASCPRARFVCVGDGRPEYLIELLALSDALGVAHRITWLPERTDIWRVYNALDLSVSSSISEGLSNVVAEAMASGVPCVATGVGDSPIVVANDRWLCPPRDDDALACAILRAIEDLPCAHQSVRQRIVDGYSIEALVDHTSCELSRLALFPSASTVSRPPRTTQALSGSPRIMFLTRQLDVGGAQRQLIELALGLHRVGWKVTVVTFYPGGALAARLREAGVGLLSVHKAGRWDLVSFALRLVRLVRSEQPHVIHGYLESSNVLIALLRSCFGQSRIVWGVRASNMDLAHYDRLAAIESRLGIALSRFADLIICNSEAGKHYHEAQGYPGRKMVVIPNGVDTSRFTPDAKARAALRTEWRIAPEQILVGIVARLDPMKDHRNFIRAAAQVGAVHSHVRFVCVGDGPASYRNALVDEAHALGIEGKIIWAGARDDMTRVYNALDIAVSSSSFGEGFPNTIVEAMATGVPCVVTDVGDSASIVGEFGWVCPRGDSSALARAIVSAIEARPYDASRICEHVRTAYNSAILLEKTIAQLHPLMPGSPLHSAALDWRDK